MSHLYVNVSIIIPAKDEEEYIGDCLRCLNQAIAEYGGCIEVIIVDNGSKDSTKDIAKEFKCKIIEAPGVSIGAARNAGVREAKGEIIAFLDADCLVHPKWITYCIEHVKDVQIGAVGTRNIPDIRKATWVERCFYKLISGAERPNYVDWLGTLNLFVRKDLFNEVGGFDESLKTAEDVNLGYKISQKKNFS